MKTFVLMALLSASALTVSAQTLNGVYRGLWTSGGFEFTFLLDMQEKDGTLSGYLLWKVVRFPADNAYYRNKPENAWAKEYFTGTVISGNTVKLTGTHKDDPFAIISLDEYELTFTDNREIFTGKTENNGTWKGRISGKKADLM